MDEPTLVCPQCHITVRPTDYFCFNCGKNLRPAPPPIDIAHQAQLYLGSVLLPPIGVIWAVKYLRVSDPKVRIIGWVCIVLTVISVLVATYLIVETIATVNEQVNSQLQGLTGF